MILESDYLKGTHQEESLKNLKQLFSKNAPSRTRVFFLVWCGVSMISTTAAHQRLLLWLQTSR